MRKVGVLPKRIKNDEEKRRKIACLRIACENEMKNGRMDVLGRS